MKGTFGGANWANVHHITFGTDFLTAAAASALATGFRNAWNAQIYARLHSSVTLQSVTVQDLGSDLGAIGVNSTPASGIQSGTANAANVALCVSWQHGRHYRGGHPRTYYPGTITTDMTNPTTWAATTLSSWQTTINAYLAAINALSGSGYGPVALSVVHYKMHGSVLADPLVDPITGASIDSRIDSQRRRLGKDR
jgi:hypothetical protein